MDKVRSARLDRAKSESARNVTTGIASPHRRRRSRPRKTFRIGMFRIVLMNHQAPSLSSRDFIQMMSATSVQRSNLSQRDPSPMPLTAEWGRELRPAGAGPQFVRSYYGNLEPSHFLT